MIGQQQTHHSLNDIFGQVDPKKEKKITHVTYCAISWEKQHWTNKSTRESSIEIDAKQCQQNPTNYGLTNVGLPSKVSLA